MTDSFIAELIKNVALLLVFSFLYGLRWVDNIHSKKLLPKIFAGILIGTIGIFLMINRWYYLPGHSFDLRTILLSIAGLYLGAIPTLVAILIMGAYRFMIGGEYLIIGIFLIISSGLMGIGWRYLQQKRGAKNTIASLYVFGLLVHSIMMLWPIWLPREEFQQLVWIIAFPVVIIYPIITVLMGLFMNRQLQNWENDKSKDRLIESEQRLARIMQNINIFFFSLDLNGNFLSCNKYLLEYTGYSEEELIGKSAVDIFLPEDEKEKAVDAVSGLLQNGTDMYYLEGEVLTKDKKMLQVISHIMLAKDKDGKINGISILAENVTEKNAIIAKLKEAKEKAEESNRLKSVFLQNISHEIRTPMNAIIGFISLLKDSPVDEATRYQFYEILNKSGERLLATVNDLIDISQIETQQIKVNKSDVSLSEILENHSDVSKYLATKRNNKIICTSKYLHSETVLNTDKKLLNSIFSNLLNNAMKFTSNGTIEIGSRDKDNDIIFYVKDTGIGIPKKRLDAIFDRFVQADLTLSRPNEGSGLGLSIAKAYAHMLGGDLWVESEEGKGSTFFFSIPKDEVKPEESITNKTESIEKCLKQNSKILVAEDDEMSYLFLKKLLEQKGIRIVRAKNGAEAVELVKNDNEISLVLMDIKMPKVSGDEATRQIRVFNKDIPIIAQTAFAMPADKTKFLEMGCNDYLSKPIETNKLIKLLHKYMGPSN